MRKTFTIRLSCLLVCFVIIVCAAFSVGALDDSYRIDELGMSLKIPKEYVVITRETERGDEAFSKLNRDYDETMTAFDLDNIYLQAVSEEGLRINLRQITDDNSKEINNYSDLSEAQREKALDTFLKNEACTSGVEIKHNDNIFFDLSVTQKSLSGDIYIYQCHTVINGMNIDLTLEKAKERLTADEIKIITNVANSMEFDEIYLKNGPSFEWWRFLLWIIILVAVAVIANYIYRIYNQNRKEKIRSRPHRHDVDFDKDNEVSTLVDEIPAHETRNKKSLLAQLGFDESDEAAFDELLGYDNTDYHSRSNSEMDSFDIKVKGKNHKAVSYFEDDNKEKSKNGDYFDDFFDEKASDSIQVKNEKKSFAFYLKDVLRHLRYFCINVWRLIFPSKKTKRNSRKK